jgi:hypothetical protein
LREAGLFAYVRVSRKAGFLLALTLIP